MVKCNCAEQSQRIKKVLQQNMCCNGCYMSATYNDGLEAACEKSLHKMKEPPALPLQIVMIFGRTKHSRSVCWLIWHLCR